MDRRIEAGKTSNRSLTKSEYVKTSSLGSSEIAGAPGCFGWLPSGIAALVAGTIVALITWNALLLLPIVLGGALLGYVAEIIVPLVYDEVDVRWLRLGKTDEAVVLIFFLVGPAVALLTAFLVLTLVA